jgi:hypothetical protein
MITNRKLGIGALLATMMLISMVFVPAVSAQAESNGLSTYSDESRVIIENTPDIEVIENTGTSNIIQIGDIVISLKSNSQHTEAVMEIRDLISNECTTINYEVLNVSGKFTTNVYYEGELYNTYVTNYDPLEPGVTKELLDNNAKSVLDGVQVTTRSTSYLWDGVHFVKGSGVKYPHPDYNAYNGEVWENFYIAGNELKHHHMSDTRSNTIANLAPVAAGAAIGAYLGQAPGAVVGAVLGLILGGASCSVLLDEEGCIWYWDSYGWNQIIIPVSPYVMYLPEYFRISVYTLWDGASIGNP